MILKHNYWYFDSAFSPEECDNLIKRGEKTINDLKKSGENASATTFGDNYKDVMPDAQPLNDKTIRETNKQTYVRDSEVCWFKDDELKEKIYHYINLANKNAGWNFQWDFGEDIQFTKYGLNQFYGWHYDGCSDHWSTYKRYIPGISPTKKDGSKPHEYCFKGQYNQVGKTRKISVTINLSRPEDYDGGNLKFDFGHHNKDIERFYECKEIRPQGSIIVFPSFLYHQVTPVTSGNRYSLVMWCLGQPFK